MRFTLLTLSTLATLGLATPTGTDTPFSYLPLTFTFYGGPASYELSFAADGNTYNTNNDLSINLIDGGGFNAWSSCIFYTTGQQTLVGSQAGEYVTVGPPQPIVSVACQPTPAPPNTCLPVYAQCEWCGGGFGGCQVLDCCSGYCAATKCRPT
ncbi:hypothetical protein G7Y89_g12855 [Cudoniella acicularis]|uniref:Uncharacterized protein n=1 Tax=Cudoniella acicularis TaxID=354080 RepID=A0A8H4RB09_9HELO|nr:hypothetical protein G7Y89_g12855 [Cudoniella acicularis]